MQQISSSTIFLTQWQNRCKLWHTSFHEYGGWLQCVPCFCYFLSIQWTYVTIIVAKHWLVYVPLCRVSAPQLRQVADRLSRRMTRFNTRSVHVRFCGGRSNFGTGSSPSTSALPPNIILPTIISIRPTTSSAVRPQQTTALFNNTTAPYISSPQCIHTFRMIATINSNYVVMKHYNVLSFINAEKGLAMRSELGFYSNLIIQTANTHSHAGSNARTSLHSVSRHFRWTHLRGNKKKAIFTPTLKTFTA